MGHDEMEELLTFYKVLSDETRLKMLGVLASGPVAVEELAERVGVRTPTVSHHLARLKAAGLVRVRPEGTKRLYSLDSKALRERNKRVLTPQRMASFVEPTDADDEERKVLRDFFDGDRLVEIPAARKKRDVVLRWLASRFEPGRDYAEKEVNEILRRHHADVAYLRRELIQDANGLMRRHGGVYRRT